MFVFKSKFRKLGRAHFPAKVYTAKMYSYTLVETAVHMDIDGLIVPPKKQILVETKSILPCLLDAWNKKVTSLKK